MGMEMRRIIIIVSRVSLVVREITMLIREISNQMEVKVHFEREIIIIRIWEKQVQINMFQMFQRLIIIIIKWAMEKDNKNIKINNINFKILLILNNKNNHKNMEFHIKL